MEPPLESPLSVTWRDDGTAIQRYNCWTVGAIRPCDLDPRLWWFIKPAHQPAGQAQCAYTPMVTDDFGCLVPCPALFLSFLDYPEPEH